MSFPTLQGRYDFLDDLIGRLTYSSGIARPGFEQITPGASISVSSASVTVGNPALKPTIGQNFDATLEFYPGDGQIAAVGLFDKQFSNYILLTQQIVPGYNFPGAHRRHHDGAELHQRPSARPRSRGTVPAAAEIATAPSDGFGYSGNVTWEIPRHRFTPASTDCCLRPRV